MIEAKRKAEIRGKVDRIIKEADKYHFIHATYACQLMIKGMVSEYYTKRYRDLSEKIKREIKLGHDISDELTDEYNNLTVMVSQGRAHIDVDYIETSSEDEARVIKINNAFVINLPKSLGKRVIKENGDYNKDVVEKIRSLMAHELGHIVLHTDELLKIDSTQGTKVIKEDNKEAEAHYFASEIIEKRDERNKRLHAAK